METLQDKTACLDKLERCGKTLAYFQSKLDSYLYEPTTKTLFDTKQYLIEKIGTLAKANETMLEYLRATRELLPEQYQLVNQYIKKTFELEFDVMDYTTQFKNTTS